MNKGLNSSNIDAILAMNEAIRVVRPFSRWRYITKSSGRVLLFIDALLKAFIELFEYLKINEKTASQVIKEINLMFYTTFGQTEFNSLIEDRSGSNMNFIQLFARFRKYSNYFSNKLSPNFKMLHLLLCLMNYLYFWKWNLRTTSTCSI
jgi:hypothetical protein